MSRPSRKRSQAPAAAEAGGATSFHALTKHALPVLFKKTASDTKPVVQVVGAHRFLLDDTFEDVTGLSIAPAPVSDADSPPSAPAGGAGAVQHLRAAAPAGERHAYAYDIVVAGGRELLRCVLSPVLSHLVGRGEIRANCFLRIDEWVYPRYNELVMGGGDALLIVTRATPLPTDGKQLLGPEGLAALTWAVPNHATQVGSDPTAHDCCVANLPGL